MSDAEHIIRADEVKEGDLVDLEHVPVPYVSREDAENYYAYELARVEGWERETDDCIRIDFDSTSIGFPLDFKLTRVQR